MIGTLITLSVSSLEYKLDKMFKSEVKSNLDLYNLLEEIGDCNLQDEVKLLAKKLKDGEIPSSIALGRSVQLF